MDSMETVKILKALADANRLHILELLGSGEQCACVLLGIWIFLNQHSHTT